MSKKSDVFRIPAPDVTESGYIFYPIVRYSRIVPFGYMVSPDDPDILLPVEKELILFEEAKKHLKQYSLRDVAAWLSAKSGRSISHVGLDNRVKAEQKQEKEYVNAKRLAKKFKDAYTKAKRIEAIRLGKREPTDEEIHQELYTSVSETLKD
jgi:hypothetical protein